MKKTISLLLSALFIMTAAVTAFANTENTITLSPEYKTGIVLENGFLEVNKEYFFPVNVSYSNESAVPLTEETLKDYNFRVGVSNEELFNDVKLVTIKGVTGVIIDVKDSFNPNSEEATLKMKFYKKGESQNKASETLLNFSVGNKTSEKSVVDGFKKGDVIEITFENHIFSKEQLEKIADINDNKPVTFKGANWQLTANVNTMEGLNLKNSGAPNMDIIERYPNANLNFISFPANNSFKQSAILEIDVSDISNSYLQRFHVYRIEGDRLVPITASYDHNEEVLTISTRTFGEFIISDKKLA